jgi:hypothetical protein
MFLLVLTIMVYRAWRKRELPDKDNEIDRELAG